MWRKNAFHARLSSTVLGKKISDILRSCYFCGIWGLYVSKPLLDSFLYIPNVWKIGVISLSDIVKICSYSEIPPAFTDTSTLQLSFKVMATVVVMVMMMKILFFYQNLHPNHETIIQTGISCKKIPCYMRDSAGRWLIVENAKIFWSYMKHFWIFPPEKSCTNLIGLCK